MTASSRRPPLVSIILPVFNGEATVEQAIRSALAQTESAFEVIVIDDGSTDRIATVVDSIASEDERIRLAHPHGGAGGRVDHPRRHDRDDAGSYLNMDDLTVSALLAVMLTQSSSVQRMPPIANDNLIPDMGRMIP